MNPAGAPPGNGHVPVDRDKIVRGSEMLGEMGGLIRRKQYSIRTEQAYLEWAKRYILFHGKRHPKDMGEAQIVAFLSHLAVERQVAASTQNQALNALVFLYKRVLGREDLVLENVARAKRPERLPIVFDRSEVKLPLNSAAAVPGRMPGPSTAAPKYRKHQSEHNVRHPHADSPVPELMAAKGCRPTMFPLLGRARTSSCPSVLCGPAHPRHRARAPSRHKDIRTTMIYTHVTNKGPLGVRSPLSGLTGLSSLETD